MVLGIVIVVTVIVCFRLRSKRNNIAKDVYACIDENSTAFQLTTRGFNATNAEINNNDNITQDPMYTDIMLIITWETDNNPMTITDS